jgi:S-adenosylmethionine synthetase
MADQISDAVLDAIISEDPSGRVACESLLTTGLVVLAGEVTTNVKLNVSDIVRETIRDIGYTDDSAGFCAQTCGVLVSLVRQSPDIALGVDSSEEKEQGAGDQGLMFGYAIDETPELMPTPIMYAHKLARKLAEVRKSGKLWFLRPDGKTQVTVRYEGLIPAAVDAVVVSSQHSADVSSRDVHEGILEEVIRPVISEELITSSTKIYINPTGRFVIGGPNGDTGLTGRKIIIDTYGGWARQWGRGILWQGPIEGGQECELHGKVCCKECGGSGACKEV